MIASADSLAPDFLPDLVARVIAAGPRLACHVRPIDPGFDELSQALDAGDVDLVISNEPRPREDLRTGTLYRDEVVCMVRAGHPALNDRRLTLARYLRLRHLVPHAAAQPRTGPIDGALAKAGYQRRISATLPEFNQLPLLLTRSDLVFTTARRFAEHHAALLPLVLLRAPAELPPMRFYQLWHERVHASASSRWIREQVSDVARGITGAV